MTAARSRRCEECGKPTRGPEESFCDECWSVPEADKPDAAYMTDAERMALVESNIEARRIDRAKQTKFCPACGSGMLGGVMGDHSLVGCVDCGHVAAKYLVKYEAVRRGA